MPRGAHHDPCSSGPSNVGAVQQGANEGELWVFQSQLPTLAFFGGELWVCAGPLSWQRASPRAASRGAFSRRRMPPLDSTEGRPKVRL
mmetsp:Transcript_8776/g.30970  ORF Transcript_8776/g.30970 Transcript_8776/m.30970 type:complete len:88 (-) Transcript_8776:507-770(-)